MKGTRWYWRVVYEPQPCSLSKGFAGRADSKPLSQMQPIWKPIWQAVASASQRRMYVPMQAPAGRARHALHSYTCHPFPKTPAKTTSLHPLHSQQPPLPLSLHRAARQRLQLRRRRVPLGWGATAGRCDGAAPKCRRLAAAARRPKARRQRRPRLDRPQWRSEPRP